MFDLTLSEALLLRFFSFLLALALRLVVLTSLLSDPASAKETFFRVFDLLFFIDDRVVVVALGANLFASLVLFDPE